MQLTYLAAVLIATAFPTISSAALCTESEAAMPSVESYNLWNKVMIAMRTLMEEPQTSGSRLMKRVEWNYPPVDCTASEKCLAFDAMMVCYDEKTTIMRSEDGLSITLKNGDILMTDNTKGNVYNDKKPIVNHLHKLMQELREKQAMEWVASANGSSAPAATKTADPVAQSAASSASAATAPAVPSGSEEAKSDAARMILGGGGWIVAGAAALAAVVLG